MSDTGQQLEQAYSLIKTGREKEAVALLMPILKADKNNANAWWLMANALEKPEHVRAALENVLRLRPNNDKARQMLVKVNTLYPAIGTSKGDTPSSKPAPVQAQSAAPQSAPSPTPQPLKPKPAPDPFDDPFAAPSVPAAKSTPSTPDPFDNPFAVPSAPAAKAATAAPDPFDDPFAPPSAPPPAPPPAPQAASRPQAVGIAGFIPLGGQQSSAAAPVYEPFAAAADNPFAAPVKSQPRQPARTLDDDPFADDDPFGEAEEPFGDAPQAVSSFSLPLAPVTPSRARTTREEYRAPAVELDDDPFPEDDLFGEDDDDLFAEVASDTSDPFADLQPTKQASGGLPLPTLLLILALIAAIVIIPLALLGLGNPPEAPAESANVAQFVAQAEAIAPRDVDVLGVIGIDEMRTDNVANARKDGWAFVGQKGQFIVVELTAVNDIYFDPYLTLIAPDGDVIASNDDIVFAVNLNSRLSLRLPEDGVYLIVVEDNFGYARTGNYELIVRLE